METRVMEIWIDVKGYEGRYQVSNLGRVKSLNYGRYGGEEIMRGGHTTTGYTQVNLKLNGKGRAKYVHRLVAKAFLSNPKNKPTVNHINGIKDDNRLQNLEWATISENIKHAYDTGLFKNPSLGKFGADSPTSRPVCQYTKEGIYMNEFSALAEAQRRTGICLQNIYRCCKGKAKSAGGYIWKYKNGD